MTINKYKTWLYLLLFSFAYEKPLIILSSMDKLNPRLFDIVLILGLLFTYGNKSSFNDEIYKKWCSIIAWFSICVMLGFLLFNIALDTKFFMLYYLLEYYKGVLALFILFKIPSGRVSLDDVFYPIIYGGVFVSLYCVYEITVGIEQVVLSDSLVLNKPRWLVWGPFVGAYFHIAVYMPLVTTLLFSKLVSSKGGKWGWFVLFIFCSWPIFFCGSRTAIFLWLVTILCVTYYNKKNRFVFFVGLASVIPLIFVIFTSKSLSGNDTINRLQSFESSASTHADNSIVSRALYAANFGLTKYDEHTLLPIIGGGFYVAPVEGNARIGYGFHNIYFFIFEQSGFIGVLLFLVFIISFLKKGLRFLNIEYEDTYYWFILAVVAYMVSSLILGWAGHTFWRGFATSNFNTLRVLLLVVASCYISKAHFINNSSGRL